MEIRGGSVSYRAGGPKASYRVSHAKPVSAAEGRLGDVDDRRNLVSLGLEFRLFLDRDEPPISVSKKRQPPGRELVQGQLRGEGRVSSPDIASERS